MNNKKVFVPRYLRHEAYQHNIAPRLEGAVKNRGTRSVRKATRRRLSGSLKKM